MPLCTRAYVRECEREKSKHTSCHVGSCFQTLPFLETFRLESWLEGSFAGPSFGVPLPQDAWDTCPLQVTGTSLLSRIVLSIVGKCSSLLSPLYIHLLNNQHLMMPCVRFKKKKAGSMSLRNSLMCEGLRPVKR